MFLFEGTDFAAHTHTFGEYIHQVVVTFVNLPAELVQVFCSLMLRTDYEQVQDVVKDIGSNLLCGIAPCALRIAV